MNIQAPGPAGGRSGQAISVVIATRNHGDRIRRTLESLLACVGVEREVIVVDQSDDDRTGEVVRSLATDLPVRHVPTRTTGVSAGRNLGVQQAGNEIVAITDDDCQVAPDWLAETLAAFGTDPAIAVVCGNVVPAPHDRAQGFIVGYERREPFLARGVLDKHRVEGTSACMAIRRSAWHALGGFDELMGVGAPLRAAGETDFFVRALLAGYRVYETPRVRVVNTSFFPWTHGLGVIQRYLYGNGALLAKHLKCGHWAVLGVYARMVGRLGWGGRAVYTGDRGQRRHRVRWFAQGFVAGLRTPVDPTRCLFRSPGGVGR